MKNIDIFNLVNSGILSITANNLNAANAYKVIGFKRAVKKALETVSDAEKDIIKEVGIEDAQAFDKERADLRKSGENAERLAELDKTYERFAELQKKLYNEKVALDCKTIPYEQFHALQKENAEMKFMPLNVFEEVLEGILWEEPQE